MTQRDDYNSKNVRLILKEAGLAATCIEQGLTALRKANFAQKWNYYQAFFLLSIGVERLLKLTVVTKYRVELNKLPDNGELKKYGHDIEKLYVKVLTEIDPEDNFIKEDNLYSSILQFISEFAKSSRYYNLDSLSGSDKGNDPLYQWSLIQKEVVKRHCMPIQLSLEEKFLVEVMGANSHVIHTTESDKEIDNFLDFYSQGKNLDQVQGYSVFYVYKIISHLVGKLQFLSNKVYMMPVLNEFFPLFSAGSMSTNEIIKKKNWNNLTDPK